MIGRRVRLRRRTAPRVSYGMSDNQFRALARYNTERAHGIVHDAEADRRMAELQRQFHEVQRLWCSNCGRELLSGELYARGQRGDIRCAQCYSASNKGD